MLRLFTLYTFKKIFENVEFELSNNAKMLYINLLIFHFEKLPISEKNSHGFKIVKNDFNSLDFENKDLIDLERANLILMNHDDCIYFNNVWGKWIDRTMLVNDSLVNALNTAERFKEQLLNSVSTSNYLCMKYKLSSEKYIALVNDFCEKQTAMLKTYVDLHDVTKHFYYWVGKNENSFNGKGQSTNILGM